MPCCFRPKLLVFVSYPIGGGGQASNVDGGCISDQVIRMMCGLQMRPLADADPQNFRIHILMLIIFLQIPCREFYY